MKPLFDLGQVVATPGALQKLEDSNTSPDELLGRHVCGDWGDLCAEDKALNDSAVTDAGRILSAYKLPNGKVWVITEWNRSVTTILTPEEY